MTQIHMRSEDEQAALGATYMDEVDLIHSPQDGLIVLVAIKGGRQVCQQCGGTFDESQPKLKSTEVSFSPGSPRLKMHAGCEARPAQIQNKFRGLEFRRKLARITKQSAGIEAATVDSSNRIVE